MVHTVGQSGSYSLPGFFLQSTLGEYRRELQAADCRHNCRQSGVCARRGLFGHGKEECQGQARREEANGVLSGGKKRRVRKLAARRGKARCPRQDRACSPMWPPDGAIEPRRSWPGSGGRAGRAALPGRSGAELVGAGGGYSCLRKAWRNAVSWGRGPALGSQLRALSRALSRTLSSRTA